MSVLSSAHFHDEAKAFAFLESIVWANGAICPHCGVVGGRIYDLAGVRSKPSKKNPEGVVRHGLKKCGECRKQFTVKVGTVFEHARMPLHKMLQTMHLIVSSKKGISAHELSRILEVQYKTAWFLAHRIREAMNPAETALLGGGGGRVEVDETYIGRRKGVDAKRGAGHKHRVVSLVDRETGEAPTVFTPPPLPLVPKREEIEAKAGEEMDRFTVDEGVVKIVFPSGMTSDSVEELEQFFVLFIKKAKRRAGATQNSA